MNIFEAIKGKDIPQILRQIKTLVWVKILLSQVQKISDLFDVFKAIIDKKLWYNGQVQYLEKALNDENDNILRRIYITDPLPNNNIPAYLFRRGENQITVILYRNTEGVNVYPLYRQTESPTVDFVVFVPLTVANSATLTKINATINFYKLASKTYAIQTF